MEEARQLIGGLRPQILEEMGVVSAISYLIDNLPRNKIAIDFDAKVQTDAFRAAVGGRDISDRSAVY